MKILSKGMLRLWIICINFEIMKQTTTQFEFSAKPKVTALKPKYREREDERFDATNLMNDPRVVRGNTYAAIIANKNQIQPPALPKKTGNETKKQPKRERRINFDTGFEPATPRAMDGRDHFTTQTEPFVETLRDKPIQYEKQSQTDLFLDRPVQRAFDPMAQKTGVDRNTQVDENDPQLFNFDYEVQPILDALLSKVLETSRMELYEEGQMKQKEKQKIQYEKRRHTLLAEAQKLESNENRLREEYERRHLQFRKSKDQEIFAQKKVIGRILSKQYLKNLQQNTETMLEHEGFFRHPLELDIYQQFLPWLYQQIHEELSENEKYKKFVEEAIKESEQQKLKQSQASIDHEKNRIQLIINERIRKKEQKEARKEAERLKKEEEAEAQRKAEEEAKQEPESVPPA